MATPFFWRRRQVAPLRPSSFFNGAYQKVIVFTRKKGSRLSSKSDCNSWHKVIVNQRRK
jgi:hypothetical protein